MIKLSEILGKPIINLYESKIEGTAKNVCFDDSFKKLTQLIIFNESDLAGDKLIETSSIYKLGNDAILIKNSDCINLSFTKSNYKQNNPINKRAYSVDGKLLGNVLDVELNTKYQINAILLSSGKTLKPSDIINSGNKALIIHLAEKKIKISTFANKPVPEQIESNLQPKVKIMQLSNMALKEEETKVVKIAYNKSCAIPKKITTKNQILIGRKITKNIYSAGKKLLAKKDSVITKKIITSAQTYGKLRELTINSK